jgi:hypothetical protein
MCFDKLRKRGKEWEKEKDGVEVLIWLYEQLQRDRDWEGERQEGRRHDDHRLKKAADDDANGKQERIRQQQQEKEAHSSFLCGHLAVLFGLLMMGNLGLENRSVILGIDASPTQISSRPTPKRHRRKALDLDDEDGRTPTKTRTAPRPILRLDRLADQAKAFGVFYAVVSRRMGVAGRGRRRGALSLALGHEGDGAEESDCEEEGEGGSRVVSGVVEFLEGLRDSMSV